MREDPGPTLHVPAPGLANNAEEHFRESDITVISRRDAADAVIMSLDHYNSLMETVHLLESPANAAHLAQSIAQLRSGQAHRRDLDEDGPTDAASAT